MTDYRTIPPEGQFDSHACWAACLAWWLRAVRGGRPSWTQTQVITEYDRHTDDSGGFPPERLLEVWRADRRLKIDGGVFATRSWRTGRMPLGEAPVIIAFNYPTIGGSHMHVLFGYGSEGHARTMTAMEPYFPYPGRDGQRTGRFEAQTVDFYIRDSRNVLLFWPKVEMGGG